MSFLITRGNYCALAKLLSTAILSVVNPALWFQNGENRDKIIVRSDHPRVANHPITRSLLAPNVQIPHMVKYGGKSMEVWTVSFVRRLRRFWCRVAFAIVWTVEYFLYMVFKEKSIASLRLATLYTVVSATVPCSFSSTSPQ